jgi:tetratricopeptide (TPR) repeat protein
LESLLDAIKRERLEDPEALSRIHAGLVFTYLDAGLYAKAAESGAELEQLAPRLSDPLRIAQMHMNVARLHLVEGRVDEAERSLARAEDAYRHLGLKAELAGAHLAQGYVSSRDGRLSEARERLAQAVAIFEETANERDLPRAINELARVERLEGNTPRARDLLERSIALLSDKDTPILAWAHRELGLAVEQTDPYLAEKNLRTAIELYERSEQPVDLAVTYRALGDHLTARGDGAGGCEAYRTGIMGLEPHL